MTNKLSMEKHKKAQKSRSLAIGLSLAALVILFYLITVLKIGHNVFLSGQ
ncbi:hypothetical protein [Polycladidibacter stylochi]|nr:hypothetical protein [Pseudovibrio stylochi]